MRSLFWSIAFALCCLAACSRVVPPPPAASEHLDRPTATEQIATTPSSPTNASDVATDTGDADPDHLITPEPESTLQEEIEELTQLGPWEEGEKPPEETVQYDFPVTVNRQVEFYLDLFQNRQRDVFARWLRRSGRYLPMIRERLARAGLPQDLAWLPMIESGFVTRARSRAGAVGPWQFMKSTARHYGLTVNRYVDQRRDPVAATDAAILFLRELYEDFGSWPLAVAAYNAGAGTIRRAMRKSGATTFWEIARTRYLRTETKRYVPKLIAAIIIAKQPEKYGFADIDYDPPLTYETVEVPRWTPLGAVAVASGTDLDHLRELNPELRQKTTPPDRPYTLKVPPGTAKRVASTLPKVRAVVRTTYATHVVGRGDTIDKVCRRYQIDKLTLLKANDLRKTKLIPGRRLRIPVQRTEYRIVDAAHPPAAGELVMHRVRPGETLGSIARKYHVTIAQLVSWNGIENPNRIRAGSRLALYLAGDDDTSGKPILVTEKRKQRPKATAPRITYYRVKRGDSLWKIARRFKVSTEAIRAWNNLKGSLIHPGTRLLLKLPADIDA